MKETENNERVDSPPPREFIRPFAAGSRQAPDPYDQYLDNHGYYRKHTARNSTSLFRVISEQIYGIQRHHERVRRECVDYMHQHREHFLNAITKRDWDFDNYLMDMAKTKTYGTILELKAMGMRYEANIMIFEPYTDGKWLEKPNPSYQRTIRVFHAPVQQPLHFDTIFTRQYIEKAAYCQAVVYEILYKKVFLLPDVDFAVEHMLNDPLGEHTVYSVDAHGVEQVVVEGGREIRFDSAHNTECILEDFRFCHFHNKDGYRQEYEGYQAAKRAPENSEKIKGRFNSDIFLHNADISCVRQLLKEGITPFPYKIAKALEPSIYRNIEYDLWVDGRRESKAKKIKSNEFQFKIGTKCLLRYLDSNGSYSVCSIQSISKDKMSYEVYVEPTGEVLNVSYKNLVAISHGKVTYRRALINPSQLKKVLKKQAFYTNQYQEIFRQKHGLPMLSPSDKFDLPIPPQQFIVMPLMVNNNGAPAAAGGGNGGNGGNGAEGENARDNVEELNENIEIESGYTSLNLTGQSSLITEASGPANPPVGYIYVPCYPPPYSNPAMQAPLVPFAQYSQQPYWAYQAGGAGGGLMTQPLQPMPSTTINYNAIFSSKIDGSDLPWNDLPTLRYFYNLGLESFRERENLATVPTLREPPNEMQQPSPQPPNEGDQYIPQHYVHSHRGNRGRGRGHHHQSSNDRGRGGAHSNNGRRYTNQPHNSFVSRQNSYGRDRDRQSTPETSGNNKPPTFQRTNSIKKEVVSEVDNAEQGTPIQQSNSSGHGHAIPTIMSSYNRTPLSTVTDEPQQPQQQQHPMNFTQPPPSLDYPQPSYAMQPAIPMQLASNDPNNLAPIVDANVLRQSPMQYSWGVNAAPMQNFMFYTGYQQPNAALYNSNYFPNFYNQQ